MIRRSVFVLSATASAINVIKSLRQHDDTKLFVSDINFYASGLYEDGVTPVLLPRARERKTYRQALDRAIIENHIEVLLPTSDHDVEATTAMLAEGWNPSVRMFRPKANVQRLLANKLAIASHLLRLGLPAPRTWRSAEEAKFPAVVKPAREGGSKGVMIVQSREAAKKAIASVCARYGPDVLIQEYVPGGTGSTYISLMLFDGAGQLVANSIMRSSLTYYTWGGGGNAGYLVEDAEIADVSRAIVAAAGGWCGPLNLEFRRHAETGKLFLIEANCRLNGYSYLTTMNGMNYPRAIVDLLYGIDRSQIWLHPNSKGTNFILGFREKIIDRWVAEA